MSLQRKTPLRPKKPWPRKKPSIEQLKEEGLVVKASSLGKPRKKMRPRAKKKPGQMSQVEFFMSIWNERPHVSQISGLPLADPPDDRDDEAGMRAWLSSFSHILPKGSYRKMKDNPRNIVLKTPQEHHLWETQKKSLTGNPLWDWVFELEQDLKDEANGLKVINNDSDW